MSSQLEQKSEDLPRLWKHLPEKNICMAQGWSTPPQPGHCTWSCPPPPCGGGKGVVLVYIVQYSMLEYSMVWPDHVTTYTIYITVLSTFLWIMFAFCGNFARLVRIFSEALLSTVQNPPEKPQVPGIARGSPSDITRENQTCPKTNFRPQPEKRRKGHQADSVFQAKVPA